MSNIWLFSDVTVPTPASAHPAPLLLSRCGFHKTNTGIGSPILTDDEPIRWEEQKATEQRENERQRISDAIPFAGSHWQRREQAEERFPPRQAVSQPADAQVGVWRPSRIAPSGFSWREREVASVGASGGANRQIISLEHPGSLASEGGAAIWRPRRFQQGI